LALQGVEGSSGAVVDAFTQHGGRSSEARAMTLLKSVLSFVVCTVVVSGMAHGLGGAASQPWLPVLALALNWTVGSACALAGSEKLYDLTGTCTFLLLRY
jgi:hypothetical protein